MSFIAVAAGQVIKATHVQQFTNWLTASKLDTPVTVAATSTTEYTFTVRSEDGGTGLALNVLYGGASAPSTIATFNKAHVKFTVTTAWAQMATPASGPGVGMTSIYAKTDGTVGAKAGTSATELVLGGGMTNPMTATGDIIYGGASGVPTRLAVGTSNWMLQAVGSSVTWAASLQSLMVSQADLVYATTANVPARLAKGTAFQELVVNAAATGVTWASGALAVVQTQGDLIYGTATNAVARLIRGLPYQTLTMDGAGTTPNWQYCVQGLASAAGDLIYADGANSLVRLPIGTNNFNLQVAGAALTYAASLMSLLTTTGDIVYATSANTPARLGIGASGTILHGGTIPSYSKVTAADIVTGTTTMMKIGEVTGTGTTGVIEFASIVSSFRALEVHVWGRVTGSAGPASLQLTFEASPTTGAYNGQLLRGNGLVVSAGENTGGTNYIGVGVLPGTGAAAGVGGGLTVTIPEYGNTAYFKVLSAVSMGISAITTAGFFCDNTIGLWESTAAINYLRLTLSAGNFETSARVSLWGLPS